MHLFCSVRVDEVCQDRSDDEHTNTMGVFAEGRTVAEASFGSRRGPADKRSKDPSHSRKTPRPRRVVQRLPRSDAHGHHSESELSNQHGRANKEVLGQGRPVDPMIDGWDLVLSRVAAAIKKAKGNRRLAAEILGVSERKLYRWLAKSAAKGSHRDMSVMTLSPKRAKT
jgi:DNA-binding NtrC family response regulator